MLQKSLTVKEGALLRSGKPADFSCFNMKHIDVDMFIKHIGLLAARDTRVGTIPSRGQNKKFLTRSVWLSNNNMRSMENVDKLINEILEYPLQLGWIDLSFNKIDHIDECLLHFKELKILYLHGNCISELEQIERLKPLTQLRSVTFHGNPVSDHPDYRNFVILTLPQVLNLDFTPILPKEKSSQKIPELLKAMTERTQTK